MASISTFGQPAWGRWAPQPHPQHQQHNMMGNGQEQMYYSSPPESPHVMSGQIMGPQYAMALQYGTGYSTAPSQTQSAPAPQHMVMPYAGYGGLNDMSAAPFIKQEPHNQHFEPMPHQQMTPHSFYTYQQRELKPTVNVLSPASSRRGSHGSIMTDETKLSLHTPSKTIRVNKTYDPNQDVSFSTPVDQMMRVLDPEPKIESQLPTPGATPKSEQIDCSAPTSPCGSANVNAMASPSMSPPPADLKVKRYYCDGPDCNQSFTQKVHLKTHKATHTGEKPYQCPHCPHSFSQAGNLNTHVNNHLGIKNFRCRYAGCDKEFAAKGNCDAHEKNIHNPNPKICRLDQCGKQLSTPGNLKTHINKFHQNTVAELTMRFAQYQAEGHIPEEERSLYDYFREIFKNSNKGVKGRGKGRKVNKINKISSPKKVCKPTTDSEPRQQSHRNITGGFPIQGVTVAAHLEDRTRFYGI